MRVPLGLTSLRVALPVERLEERPPEHARLRGSGRSAGDSISSDTTLELAEAGGGTEMRCAVELGGVARRRVLQPVFQRQVAAVLQQLDRELAADE